MKWGKSKNKKIAKLEKGTGQRPSLTREKTPAYLMDGGTGQGPVEKRRRD